MSDRKSGILLHISSLPGKHGIGTFGEDAYRFVDFLKECNQKVWQILPLGPTGYGNSPYQCYSAFAGNPMFIDLEKLVSAGVLTENELGKQPRFSIKKTRFQTVEKWKFPILKKAFCGFQQQFSLFENEYNSFLNKHAWWLNDYAFFMAAKQYFKHNSWLNWPNEIKFRKTEAIQNLQKDLSEDIEFRKFLQFMFFRQWYQLKEYANMQGVEIMGDLPLYVSTDSVDVWANTGIFLLNEKLHPKEVGGVPPDYFSENGQLWGNPVYNWTKLKKTEYHWWLARLHFNLTLFDSVRIDHFRGLESFWSVPAGEQTAINGKWVPANGFELLQKFKEQIGYLPLIAEDLGVITPEVERMRDSFRLPGMKVLQFAFLSDAANTNLPHNFLENFVVYTGTHDNNTTLGWLKNTNGFERKMVMKYLPGTSRSGVKRIMEMAWSANAKMAVMPMQDFLMLGEKARMNTPGTAKGNWEWRFKWKQVKERRKKFLKELTVKYNR